jgi:hypothetical protein
MYDPEGNDNMQEFIEISGTDDLANATLQVGERNATLALAKIVSGNRSLVVEEGFPVEMMNCSVYVAGATIAGGLKNTGGIVRIMTGERNEDVVEYADDLADGNGFSLERAQNGSWQESSVKGGSPCQENSDGVKVLEYDLSLHIIAPEIMFTSIEYSSLFQIKNEEYVSGESSQVQALVEYVIRENETVLVNGSFWKNVSQSVTSNTGVFIPDRVMNVTICGRIKETSLLEDQENEFVCRESAVLDVGGRGCSISLSLDLEKDVVEPGEAVGFYNRVNDSAMPFVVQYSIKEVGGGEVRNSTTENKNKKTFTPPDKGNLAAYVLENRLVSVGCNNSNSVTSDRKILLVVGSDRTEDTIQILDPGLGTDKIANIGEVIKPRIKVIRGDNDKRTVSVYVQGEKRMSEPVTISIDEKYAKVTVTVPLLLKGDCKVKEGIYTLVAEGLDNIAKEQILVKSKGCVQESVKQDSFQGQAGEERESILSFYTLTKKPSIREPVNVYARVVGKNLSLVLKNSVGGREVFREERARGDVLVPEKLAFAVRLGVGKNLIALETTSEGVVNSKSIMVEVNASEQKNEIPEVRLGASADVMRYSLPEVSGLAVQESTVVYEGSKVKYLNILLVMVVCLALFAAWWRFR